MTLGVVYECRGLGLGSMLIEEALRVLRASFLTCEVVYLHVVDYNEAAIRFYERRGFATLKRIKDHYVIFDKHYDALLLYKDIKIQPQKDMALKNT
jgi:ribosomal protein S18 acetylase RimI-like enzyme